MDCYTPGAEIRFTLDGETPSERSNRYTAPLVLDRSTTLKAVAFCPGLWPSSVESVDFIRVPYRRTIVYGHAYHPSYTAGGDNGLLDGIRGETNSFADWQGFLGADLSATVDLGEERRIRRIATGFLQNHGAWIYLPTSVEYSLSLDGEEFTPVARITNPIPQDRPGAFSREFEKRIRGVRARYVRIVARNVGVNPSWHPGAGEKAFLFADEIVIE
jgi:hexosaminidase